MDAMDNEEALRLLVSRPACVFTLPGMGPGAHDLGSLLSPRAARRTHRCAGRLPGAAPVALW